VTDPLRRLRPFTPAPLPCKVCGAPAAPFGEADFSRNCEEDRGVVLPKTGIAIHYRRCGDCGFLFTDAFDDWTPDDWGQAVYNEAYAQVDPDYDAVRPASNAQVVAQTFGALAATLTVLDYGGGNGRFAHDLRKAGFAQVATYDPFHPVHSARPVERFNLVTCYEAIEHMPDPLAGAADIVSFLADDALLVVSTVTQPDDIARQGMGWWYIGPRNGHISLHTRESLKRLFATLGVIVVSLNEGLHLAFRQPPSFARIPGVG
jgi:hypothetical protein